MAAPNNPAPMMRKFLLPEPEFGCDDIGVPGGAAAFVCGTACAVKFVIAGFAGGTADAFVCPFGATGDEMAGGWFGIVGEFVEAAFGGGRLVLVPMMMSGWPTMTGAGGGAWVGFGAGGGGGGAGNGGNWGKSSGSGGNPTEQPMYWPSCDLNTMTNG